METCKSNSDVDWLVFTDCGLPENCADNVKIIDMSFDDYKKLVKETLKINFNPRDPYKICDIRPAFGVVHYDLIKDYDFFGFGDLDVIYGRIRDFYDNQTLHEFSVLSTHPERVSGHFFLMRNTPHLIRAFERIPSWKDHMSCSEHVRLDQAHLKALQDVKDDGNSWWTRKSRFLFQERYSSPCATRNMNWFWKDGILSNEFYCHLRAHRGFLYLHFADWRSSRWYHFHKKYVKRGAKAPWEGIESLINIDWRQAKNEGFMISPHGIGPIVWPTYSS